jgi:hypothetical protein
VFDTIEWLDEVHAHYGRRLELPVLVAAEILLGRNEPELLAESLKVRVLDEAVEASAVAGAVDELIEAGFLEVVFSASSPARDDAEEQVLELRFPD